MGNVSSLRFAAFYYEDCARRIEELKAEFMPWHTEADPEDPFNGILEAQKWIAHRQSVADDMAGTELSWPTLRRRPSAVALGTLIGYELTGDLPGRTHVLSRLTGLPGTLPATLVVDGSLYATEPSEDGPAVVFEASEDVLCAGTALVKHETSGTVYVGHVGLQFGKVALTAAVYASGGYEYSVEFWDAAARAWAAIPGAVDGTAHLSHSGNLSWDVRGVHAGGRRWDKTEINGVEAYWIRMRPVVLGTVPCSGVSVSQPDAQGWWVHFAVVQGQTVIETVGTTTATAWQSWRLGQSPFINGSVAQVTFGGEAWERVEDFLLAGPADRVYRVEERTGGWYVVTGDGVTGRRPTSGQDVVATYRIGASENGNVGAGTITVNRSGTPRLDSVTNPRAATGWQRAEGSVSDRFATEAAALARTRQLAPATMRANGRAVTTEDHEVLAVKVFETADGRRPVARAFAVGNGAGQRSVRLYCVGPAGAAVDQADLDALRTFFEGTRKGTQREGGRVLQNATVVPVSFTQVVVNITATLQVQRKYASAAKASAESALDGHVSPLETDDSGIDWFWWSGQTYGVDAVKRPLGNVQGLVSVPSFTVNGVEGGPLALAEGAFPVAGTVVVTVQEV